MISEVSDTVVKISWDKNVNEQSLSIEYGPAGFIRGTGTSKIVATNPYTLSGLTSNTNYDIYLKTVCKDGESGFSGAIVYTTSCSGAVFKGDLYFANQQDLKDFGAKCYSAIDGNVHLIDSEVSDFSPLKSITSISGSLMIIRNNKIQNSDGFENLTTIAEGLYIQNCSTLTSIQNI